MNKEVEPLSTAEAVTDEAPATLAVLQRALIVRSKTNPRTHFDADYLKDLGESITQHGVLQPILVRPLPASRLQDTFEDREPGGPLPTHEIVCGECRWRACGLANVDNIPVLIRPLTDVQVLQVQLVENLRRRDLHPMEEAEGFGRLISDHGMTVDEIADKVGKSRSYVYKSLKLLDLTQECREQLYAGKLTQSTALLVARAPAHLQLQIAKDIMQTGFDGEPMSFRAAARLIHDRYMLQLSTAIFDISDAKLVIKAGDCKSCQKRTGAHTDLFEDVKSADTCTDPKCFDTKKVAHYEAVAKAAEAKGQKVIMGKEAKELMPHEHSSPKGYKLLDEREWVGSKYTTLRNVIGKDAPQPVLIMDPHSHQLKEALPIAVADKLVKKAASTAKAKPGKAVARDLEEEYDDAWRNEAIEQIHRAATTGAIKEIGVEIARLICTRLTDFALYGATADRFCRLFNIANAKVGRSDAIKEWLQSCPADQVAPAMLVLLVEDDAEYSRDTGKSDSSATELIARCCGIDLQAIQDSVKLAIHAEAGEDPTVPPVSKSGKPGSKAVKKAKQQATFLAPLHVSEKLAAIVGSEPLPRTEIVSKIWAYIKKNGLQDATNKRMVNADAKLKDLFGKDQVSMFEMAGLIGEHVGSATKGPHDAPPVKATKKKTSAKEAKAAIAEALQQQEGAAGGTAVDEPIEAASWPLPIVTTPPAGGRIKATKPLEPQSAWPFPTAPKKGAGK